MPNPIIGKRIVLGVTGSIACYKAADLASKLHQMGAEVDVVLTQSAQKFITPLSFESVTGRHGYTDADLWGDAGHVLHIGLAEAADLVVIAPATANTLARMAYGLADNLLTIIALAARHTVLVAPAMDGGMYAHPATQENVEKLKARGVLFAGPAAGHLASGQKGVGRMVEPAELVGHIRHLMAQDGPLKGKTVVVTAGGTHEPIDPVRVIANRSSGKQGFAIAQAALDLGARVRLVCGPVTLEAPFGAERINVGTAEEMGAAVMEAIRTADVLVMAAAVADFRAASPAKEKIKKETGPPVLQLVRNPDILKSVASLPPGAQTLQAVIGFAAESEDLLENARQKLVEKHLDMMVANDISAPDAGFSVDTNRVHLLFPDGKVVTLPLMEKAAVAENVMAHAVEILARKANQK